MRLVAVVLVFGQFLFSQASTRNGRNNSGPGTLTRRFGDFRSGPQGTFFSSSSDQFGEAALVRDDLDIWQSWFGDAGSQYHFRLSRALCVDPANPTSTANPPHACDQSFPAARHLLIVPYDFGMAMDYPSTLEFWVHELSVHNNHRNCNASSTDWRDEQGCNGAAQLWVGDINDLGGLFMTAFDDYSASTNTFNSRNSFVVLSADRFDHSSHGSMIFRVRNLNDEFAFQFGAVDHENTEIRFDSTGRGFFNGGTQTGGADFAESVSVIGEKQDYEPGDVLVIDAEGSRRLKKSAMPYETGVAGIYSTKPGVLATEHKLGSAELAAEVPLAVVGIVPCKITNENGAIRAGDLLVTSSRAGHAMKGSDRGRMLGAVIGKALEASSAADGTINVLVSLQ